MHGMLPLHNAMPEPSTRPRFALAAKGFRPFFFAASTFAVLIVPIWLAIVDGLLAPSAYLDPQNWHAHEMIFGYTVAVIAGFLLTAVANWTRRETVVGAPLIALVSLWCAGRIAMATAAILPYGVAAVLDLAFLPMLAVAIGRPLVEARNWRNLVMLAVVLALFACNVAVHLGALGLASITVPHRACMVAVDIVTLLILVFTGRVLPMFTRNATGNTHIVSAPRLDAATVAGAIAVVLVDVVEPETSVARAFAGLLAILAIARAARWGTRHVARHPLLWVLHVAYAWIPLGLLLRALPLFGVTVWSSPATHALTVGAIGAATLGMMSRVSLGHTGRPLAAPAATTWSFAAITLSAVVRVFVPLFAIAWHFDALIISGALWTIAFAIFLIVYVPVLFSPRIDGKAG